MTGIMNLLITKLSSTNQGNLMHWRRFTYIEETMKSPTQLFVETLSTQLLSNFNDASRKEIFTELSRRGFCLECGAYISPDSPKDGRKVCKCFGGEDEEEHEKYRRLTKLLSSLLTQATEAFQQGKIEEHDELILHAKNIQKQYIELLQKHPTASSQT